MPFIYGEKACSLVTRCRLKISCVFSLPLNFILLFLQLDVIILDLGPEYSFVKKRKDKFFLNRNTAINKKNNKINDRASA